MLSPDSSKLRKVTCNRGPKAGKKDDQEGEKEESDNEDEHKKQEGEGDAAPNDVEKEATRERSPVLGRKPQGERSPDSPYLSRARDLFKNLDHQEQQPEGKVAKQKQLA